MSLWSFVLPGILGALIALLFTRPAPSPGKQAAAGSVTLTFPRMRAVVACVLAIMPWTFIVLAAREPDDPWALVAIALSGVAASAGAFLFMQARRRVIISGDDIDVNGPPRCRVAWKDVGAIEAQEAGVLSSIRFVPKKGRTIAVDGTMHGWSELLRQLPQLAAGPAKAMAEQAVGELRRWEEIDRRANG